MRINLIGIGKTDSKLVQQELQYYIARMPKHWNFNWIEIPDVKSNRSLPPEALKKAQAKQLLSYIQNSDYNVLLDEKGKQITSREFAQKIERWQGASLGKVNIIIGGAYGFDEEIYALAHEKISLSKMTFTHQMIRLFITEQLYRASQILLGKPYHND